MRSTQFHEVTDEVETEYRNYPCIAQEADEEETDPDLGDDLVGDLYYEDEKEDEEEDEEDLDTDDYLNESEDLEVD